MARTPAGDPEPQPDPADRGSGSSPAGDASADLRQNAVVAVPTPWLGLVQALQRHSRIEPNATDLAPWELLLDNRLESHLAVAALRDWSRVQQRLGELDPAGDPQALFAALRELALLPEVAGPGIAAWLQRLPPEVAPAVHAATGESGPAAPALLNLPALTPVNLHLARCIHADWLGHTVLDRVRQRRAPGPTSLFDALLILEQVHDPAFARRSLTATLQAHAAQIRQSMQTDSGDSWRTQPFEKWLEHFGRLATAHGFEGQVNALNRYDACLGSGFLHNGLAIPITLCALVQYLIHHVAGGDRPIRARGLNTPGHFLLLIEEGAAQIVVDPFRGLYNLSWKTLMHQIGARELASLTPEALLLEQPSDVLPRMCLNALKRLENHQRHLLSAEYCTLHHAVSQDANLILQRALLRLRGRAPVLAREDLALVMQSDNETASKLAQKFMMREDFYLSQHPN